MAELLPSPSVALSPASVVPAGYFGIDFGTTNSYFAYCPIPHQGAPQVQNLVFDYGQSSLATSILWYPAEGPEAQVEDIGENAEERWWGYSAAEQKIRRFNTQFKPDLVVSEVARSDAEAFLRLACDKLCANNQVRRIGAAVGVPVTIGVPAQIGQPFRDTLARIARAAGLGSVTCLAEPLGALAYCLHHGQVTHHEARKGVVVVDFGGGTLDLALVDEDGVREPWGNPIVGGRLFDDLMYQWVLDQNPGRERDFDLSQLRVANRLGARVVKEAFSRAWAANRLDRFIARLKVDDTHDLGRLRNPTVEEFLERARQYRPSRILASAFAGFGGAFAELVNEGPIDLIGLVRDTIRGPRNEGRLASGASWVVLTGGSCGWPFMRSLVAEVLDVPPERIIVPEDPARVIGEGIALYPALRERFRRAREAIKGDLPDLKQELAQIVDQMIDTTASVIADRVLGELFAYTKARFREWYERGGSVKSVQDDVMAKAGVLAASSSAAEVINDEWRAVGKTVVDAVAGWLQAHGISETGNLSETARPEGLPSLPVVAPDLRGTLPTVTNVMVTGIALTLGVAAKAAVPVLLLHPAGWVMLATLVGVTLLSRQAAIEMIESRVKEFVFTASTLPALHILVSRDKLELNLAKAEQEASASFRGQLREAMRGSRKEYLDYVDAVAERALRQAGLLEELERHS